MDRPSAVADELKKIREALEKIAKRVEAEPCSRGRTMGRTLCAVRWRWTRGGPLRTGARVGESLACASRTRGEAHVRDNWLPRFGHVAVTLNWSERAS